MTRSDLITALAARIRQSMATAAGIALKEILDAIARSMARDKRIEPSVNTKKVRLVA